MLNHNWHYNWQYQSMPIAFPGPLQGEMHWAKVDFDWTEGFFPGSSWSLYEFTKNWKWKTAAEKFQAQFEDHKKFTTYHDLGFVFNSSFGNGYRLTNNEVFKQVMITAGDSLTTRFNPNVGCIKAGMLIEDGNLQETGNSLWSLIIWWISSCFLN